MNKNSISVSTGSLCSTLFIVFLILKLTKVIDWSWWWVTAPLWGGVAIMILALIILFIVSAIMTIRDKSTT